MCFSATASFAAGGLLLTAGLISYKKSKEPVQLPLASIPVVFSLQQFTEGFLWLNFKHGLFQGWEHSLTIAFILFAQVVWPTLIPLAFYFAEKEKAKRKILFSFLIIGILISIYALVCLFIYPVISEVKEYHIYYQVNYPDLGGFGSIFYFIPTILPPFVFSVRLAWGIGLLNFLSLLISELFFKDHVISVWCFFAAAISAMILALIIKINGKVHSNTLYKQISKNAD